MGCSEMVGDTYEHFQTSAGNQNRLGIGKCHLRKHDISCPNGQYFQKLIMQEMIIRAALEWCSKLQTDCFKSLYAHNMIWQPKQVRYREMPFTQTRHKQPQWPVLPKADNARNDSLRSLGMMFKTTKMVSKVCMPTTQSQSDAQRGNAKKFERSKN